jgi:hypothetical protein
VVGHLEHVRTHVRVGERRLSGHLDVAGEQEPPFPEGDPHDEALVVDVAVGGEARERVEDREPDGAAGADRPERVGAGEQGDVPVLSRER